MGKERISFSITNHICLQQAFMVHCTWPGCVHSVSPCSCPSARSACTHTVVLPAAAWSEGWRGVCNQIFSSYSLCMIDISLSPNLDTSLKHKLDDIGFCYKGHLCHLMRPIVETTLKTRNKFLNKLKIM